MVEVILVRFEFSPKLLVIIQQNTEVWKESEHNIQLIFFAARNISKIKVFTNQSCNNLKVEGSWRYLKREGANLLRGSFSGKLFGFSRPPSQHHIQYSDRLKSVRFSPSISMILNSSVCVSRFEERLYVVDTCAES